MTPIKAKPPTLWKNRKSVTRELLRHPETDNYDFRISCADIETDTDFSLFPGYDRALVVWQGNGISLDELELPALEPHYFSGEKPHHAKLINGPVRDLGVIFKKGLLATLTPLAKGTTVDYRGQALYLFMVEAQTIDGQPLDETDLLPVLETVVTDGITILIEL